MFKESNPEYSGSLTLFQVLTLDNWSQIYVTSSENGASYIMISLACYIFLEYLALLNLFTEVLEDNYLSIA
ncbi:hypothetical protein NFI96_010037 [Prochilodus magdalenae]|nr:hypothetical protein NFI96_010037 [Prochilodus magdalenae]